MILIDVARRHGDEAVHLQDRQERLVERVRRHRRRRQHRHLRAHARIDDEVLARDLADGLDDLRDVGVLELRRDRRLLLGLGLRRLRRAPRPTSAHTRLRTQSGGVVGIVLEDRHGRSLLAFLTGGPVSHSGSGVKFGVWIWRGWRCGLAAAWSSPAA